MSYFIVSFGHFITRNGKVLVNKEKLVLHALTRIEYKDSFAENQLIGDNG